MTKQASWKTYCCQWSLEIVDLADLCSLYWPWDGLHHGMKQLCESLTWNFSASFESEIKYINIYIEILTLAHSGCRLLSCLLRLSVCTSIHLSVRASIPPSYYSTGHNIQRILFIFGTAFDLSRSTNSIDYGVSIFIHKDSVVLWNFMNTLTDLLLKGAHLYVGLCLCVGRCQTYCRPLPTVTYISPSSYTEVVGTQPWLTLGRGTSICWPVSVSGQVSDIL